MKLSISNIAWGKESDLEMYEYISKQGFQAIEIAPTRIFEEAPYEKLEQAKEFYNNLKEKYNLEISSMQSIWYGKSEKIFESETARKALIDYTKKAIDFASVINCKNLVFGCPKNRNRITNSKEEYDIALDFFRQIGEYAKQKNTVFAIEANPANYNTNFLNTTKEAINLVKDVADEGVKLNFDLGTVLTNEENLESIENNLNLVNHIHISEPNLNVIQERDVHKKIAKILKNNSYDRYVSVEMKNTGDLENVKQVIRYIKEIFESDL